MRNNVMCENSLKYLCPAFVFVIGLFVYSFRATYSGLWYDEAVEYFFSKFISGNVPGSIHETSNMYERICSTYQPPLYNVLMYVWLQCFDSEALFRFAGILTTLIGMLGIYTALLKVSGYKWASAGALVYLFIPKISFYALECAEYNLMLCCESWTLYFFVRFIMHKDNLSLSGFFILSCLSVYSQYGAAFFVAGLYITLLIHCIRDKNILAKIFKLTLITGMTAVLPLAYLFTIPQMINQGSIEISHVSLFAGNNILYDFIRGIIFQAGWIFSFPGRIRFLMVIPLACLLIPLIYAVINMKGMFKLFFLSCIISWLFYYMCVVTSFYAYNSWSGNTGFGNRYGLFFVPLWLFTLIYASSMFSTTRRRKIISAILMLCFIAAGAKYIYSGWIKDDVREVSEAWYKNNGFHRITLVHQWDDANFQFYIRHNKNYRESFQEKIITAGIWIRSAEHDDMKKNLNSMGIFEYDELFYVSPLKGSLKEFISVMKESGYIIKTCYEGQSVLLYLQRLR